MHTETHSAFAKGSAAVTGDPLIGARRVAGTAVYDAAGEKIGTVDDVMLEKRSGQVAYAVMSCGGFLGIGEKLHPVPWASLDYDTELGGYRVPMTAEALKSAPAYLADDFDRDDWRDPTDRHYRTSGFISPGTLA
jgi:hypothetical protein